MRIGEGAELRLVNPNRIIQVVAKTDKGVTVYLEKSAATPETVYDPRTLEDFESDWTSALR